MKNINLALIFLALSVLSFKSDKPAYKLFNTEGNKSSYTKLIEDASEADIVFYGELHNDPVSHWLEYEITRDLHKIEENSLLMGAEMFERDDQLIINEYLDNFYESGKFEPEAKLWKNYKTDYKPLLEFARENRIPFIATNIPRRYASMVNRSGFEILDSLTDKAKDYIAPLPVKYDPELKCYKDMLNMGGGEGMKPSNTNLPKAQAIKDATMAYSIIQHWENGKIFIHYNGSYHSRNFEGIIWYLHQYKPDLKIITIETVIQEDITQLEDQYLDIASYIVCVPESMTKTY
ncbi:MAG TPA: iron-regulated protein [Bacteroidales bacterium]|nr:iron-regulated protein [Bacteroidales bacterium]